MLRGGMFSAGGAFSSFSASMASSTDDEPARFSAGPFVMARLCTVCFRGWWGCFREAVVWWCGVRGRGGGGGELERMTVFAIGQERLSRV